MMGLELLFEVYCYGQSAGGRCCGLKNLCLCITLFESRVCVKIADAATVTWGIDAGTFSQVGIISLATAITPANLEFCIGVPQ